MPEAIEKRGDFTSGFVSLPKFSGRTATATEAIQDGDTLSVITDGNFSIRLLGIDTP